MKKIISIALVILCLSLVIALFTACGNKNSDDATTTEPTSQVSTTDESTDVSEDASEVVSGDGADATENKKDNSSSTGSNKKPSSSDKDTNKKPSTTKKPQSSTTTKPAANNLGDGVELATGDIYSGWF